MDPDQTAPIGAVCSGSTLFASILNSSLLLEDQLQRTTFSDAFFFLALLGLKLFCSDSQDGSRLEILLTTYPPELYIRLNHNPSGKQQDNILKLFNDISRTI